MNQNNICGKCRYFQINNIKKYICAYHNCNINRYGEKACNAFEKCDEYYGFLGQLKKLHDKVDSGDLSDFTELKIGDD